MSWKTKQSSAPTSACDAVDFGGHREAHIYDRIQATAPRHYPAPQLNYNRERTDAEDQEQRDEVENAHRVIAEDGVVEEVGRRKT